MLIGPVLAFFLLLSLAVTIGGSGEGVLTSGASGESGAAAFLNEISGGANLVNFIISIALLLGALEVANNVGAAAYTAGTSMYAQAARAQLGVAKGVGKLGLRGAAFAAKVPAGYFARKLN